jgi:predicted alpha/beta hydrolase family esterase
MTNILFIQGGGDNGYKADATLVQNIQNELGKDYHVLYPKQKTDETAPDLGWIKQIEDEINKAGDAVIIIAHSLGASLLLKYLSENKVTTNISGVFLLATPFWSGDEDWKQGLKLRDDFPDKLPKAIPLFFYHCRDDKEVPFEQFKSYKELITDGHFHEFESGGINLTVGLIL